MLDNIDGYMKSLVENGIHVETSLDNDTYYKLGTTLILTFMLVFLAYFLIKGLFNNK